MSLKCAALSSLLLLVAACEMDMQEEFAPGATKSDSDLNSPVASDRISYRNLSIQCGGRGLVANGAFLSVTLDGGLAGSCLIVGTIDIPENVRISQFTTDVAGFAEGDLQLSVQTTINGANAGSANRHSWDDGLITGYGDLRAIGDAHCRDGGTLSLPFRIQALAQGDQAVVDSVDVAFANVQFCPPFGG